MRGDIKDNMIKSRILSLGLAAYLATAPIYGAQKPASYTLPAAGPSSRTDTTSLSPSRAVQEAYKISQELIRTGSLDMILSQKASKAKRTESLDSLPEMLKGSVVLVPIGAGYSFEKEMTVLARSEATFYLLGAKMDRTGFGEDGTAIEDALRSSPGANIEYLASEPQYDIEDDGRGSKENALALFVANGDGQTKVVPVSRDSALAIARALREQGAIVYMLQGPDRSPQSGSSAKTGDVSSRSLNDTCGLLPKIVFCDGKKSSKPQ